MTKHTHHAATLGEVQAVWLKHRAFNEYGNSYGRFWEVKAKEEFDSWLKQVKAEVWDECDGAWYHAHSLDNIEPWGYLPHNPYKETE